MTSSRILHARPSSPKNVTGIVLIAPSCASIPNGMRKVAPMKIKFNEREFKRLIQTEVQSGVNKIAAEQTRDLDRLRQQYTGRAVSEIKPALQQLFRRYDGRLTEPQLTEWAQMISDGTRVTMKAGRIQL